MWSYLCVRTPCFRLYCSHLWRIFINLNLLSLFIADDRWLLLHNVSKPVSYSVNIEHQAEVWTNLLIQWFFFYYFYIVDSYWRRQNYERTHMESCSKQKKVLKQTRMFSIFFTLHRSLLFSLEGVLAVLWVCWLLFLYSAVQLIQNHLSWL